jgi:hypothetical protein
MSYNSKFTVIKIENIPIFLVISEMNQNTKMSKVFPGVFGESGKSTLKIDAFWKAMDDEFPSSYATNAMAFWSEDGDQVTDESTVNDLILSLVKTMNPLHDEIDDTTVFAEDVMSAVNAVYRAKIVKVLKRVEPELDIP